MCAAWQQFCHTSSDCPRTETAGWQEIVAKIPCTQRRDFTRWNRCGRISPLAGVVAVEMENSGRAVLGPVNTCFALALLHKKREGKARSAGHSEPMAKLCNAAPAFFHAQPGGTGRNFTQPIVTRRLQSLLCCAARASFPPKSVTVAGAKQVLTGPSLQPPETAPG